MVAPINARKATDCPPIQNVHAYFGATSLSYSVGSKGYFPTAWA